jgi:radical SAM superfamily enzyme YgiQ (UPF0313 family)
VDDRRHSTKSKAVFILPPATPDLDMFRRPDWCVSRIPSIGLISIASFLRAKGHDARIIDCRELIVKYRTSDYVPILAEMVEKLSPDLIGINLLSALFNEVLKISAELKRRLPDCLIVAGGPHPSIEPELTFEQNPFMDALCIGAGEEVCFDILDGKKIGGIKGLMRRGHVDRFERRTLNHDVDSYPFPDFSAFSVDFYTALSLTPYWWCCRSFSAMTSRSCPYSCKFCASDWSKPFRYHSPEYVIDLAKHLASLEIEVISFFDDTIAVPLDRLQKICEGFIESKVFWPNRPLRWCAPLRADQVTPDLMQLMKRAGCFSVHIGVESASERMLNAMNKRTTPEINWVACNSVKDAGLSLSASYMIGLPGETEEEMLDTIGLMQKIGSNARGFSAFQPLPGSPFYYELVGNIDLPKERMDWSNLGDFSTVPNHLFCDVSRGRFKEILDHGSGVAFGKDLFLMVHEETLLRDREKILRIANDGPWEVRICRPENYESSTHIRLDEFVETAPEFKRFPAHRSVETSGIPGCRLMRLLPRVAQRIAGLWTLRRRSVR